MGSSSGKLIKCLSLPKIYPNIKGQSLKQELKKRDFIKALKLADTSVSPECLIDMLFGRIEIHITKYEVLDIEFVKKVRIKSFLDDLNTAANSVK